MCGIFGAVFTSGDEPVDVEAALRALRHRGPDGDGVWRAPGAVLGHTRLAILDLTPAGDQPMVSADGCVAVTFNGEIYNHHALRAELRARGHAFRSRADTEVIVEGYRAWGVGVVERLEGMFAFGLFDAAARRLLLARDHAGKKPLFYARGPRGALRFASEAKALVAAGVAGAPDPAALPVLLTLGYTPAPRTMYRGIEQLSPATTLVLEEGGAPHVRRYWRAPFDAPPFAVGPDEAAREVRGRVEAAVRRRLEADVPLGAFLSGGLDSTVVVGVMARQTSRRVKTFSIGFAGDPRYDETRYARIAARAFDTDHTEFVVEPAAFDLVERLVALHDGPFGDSSAIPTSIVAMMARRHVTVALTGDGGDELFCGYPRLLAAEAAEYVPVSLRAAAGALVARRPGAAGERAPLARLARLCAVAARPLSGRLAGWTSYFEDLPGLLRPELLAALPLGEPMSWTRAQFAPYRGASPLTQALAYNFETYLPYDLLVKADRASMAHGLELRAPLLDRTLVEYAARLPDRLRRRNFATKWLFRHAFGDVLPAAIRRRRRKMGFGLPLGAWFRAGLRDYIHDHLHAGARLGEYIQIARVERLLAEHMAGRRDHGGQLWLLLTLEVWLRSLGRSRAEAARPAPALVLAS
jgi:asparagine synthase (glutamine-hydrolysing)